MFAAASGARLAHRHNKTVKKQISTSQIEGLQVHYKGFHRQQQIKYSDGNRYANIPQRRQNYSSKLYSTDCDSGLKLSTSYIDINGRISKLGHVDFEAALFLREKQELRKKKLKIRRRRYELPSHVATRDIAPFPQFPPNSWGKAAWQDRELCHELERRESLCAPSDIAVSHKIKQREAHRRWVKRNRIHDSSFGDCSSEEEELLYGVQSGAANLLLYIGLGTMCVGMIIAFVGTGEKGFKTMELRLIGPSLIGAGVLITILRIMLCVCPSKCLKLKKHKHKLKNSTNKLNSEGNQVSQEFSTSKEPLSEATDKSLTGKVEDGKKRVAIAMLPTTSGLSANLPSSSSDNFKTPKTPAYPDGNNGFPVPTISFLEYEKPSSSKASSKKITNLITSDEDEENNGKTDFELKQLNGSNFDVTSFGSENSCRRKFPNLPETLISPDNSDISITSLVNGVSDTEPQEKKNSGKTNVSKFEIARNPKNIVPSELVLNPSNLNEPKDGD